MRQALLSTLGQQTSREKLFCVHAKLFCVHLCMVLLVPSSTYNFSWSTVSLCCNRVPTASQTAAVEIMVCLQILPSYHKFFLMASHWASGYRCTLVTSQQYILPIGHGYHYSDLMLVATIHPPWQTESIRRVYDKLPVRSNLLQLTLELQSFCRALANIYAQLNTEERCLWCEKAEEQ